MQSIEGSRKQKGKQESGHSLHVFIHPEDDVRHVVQLCGILQHALSLFSKQRLIIITCTPPRLLSH